MWKLLRLKSAMDNLYLDAGICFWAK